jgi:hypothetical protein
MTATAGYLFEGADWDFSKLQHKRPGVSHCLDCGH